MQEQENKATAMKKSDEKADAIAVIAFMTITILAAVLWLKGL